MLEAMWSVQFVSNRATGGFGIVVLETERIMGGDSSYMYVGNYRVEHGTVKANIRVTKYAPGVASVFGDIAEFNLTLEGTPGETSWELSGVMDEAPDNRIAIRLERQGELP